MGSIFAAMVVPPDTSLEGTRGRQSANLKRRRVRRSAQQLGVSRMSVVAWLKRSFRGQGRLDPTTGMLGIPSSNIRPFAKSDMDACRSLYTQNERGRFPPGYLQTFTDSLEPPAQLFLVVELLGQVAAVGGIYRTPESPQGCSLVFGMVRPELHRKGLGTALLLARLAILPRPTGLWWAFL